MGIIAAESVDHLFGELVAGALARQHVVASERTTSYLVSLCVELTHARLTDEPLSMKLALSETPGGAPRVVALKEVGDTSLYITGFFTESIERKLVAADYYIGLGEAAYRELAARLTASSVSEVYEELAAKFPRFVDVLADVRGRVDLGTTDVAALYEQWLRSRSDWVEGRLKRLGVILSVPRGDIH